MTHIRKYCNKAKDAPLLNTIGTILLVRIQKSNMMLLRKIFRFHVNPKIAFEMGLLKRFSAKLLIGQVSYNQQGDTYNYSHGYVHYVLREGSSKGHVWNSIN